MRTLSIIFRISTIFFCFLFASVLRAEEGENRHVVGGDVIYTVTSHSSTEEEAAYLAQMGVLQLTATECGVVHKSMKFFDQKVEPLADGFRATVTGGLPIEECIAAKDAKSKEGIEHPVLWPQYRNYIAKKEIISEDKSNALMKWFKSKFNVLHKDHVETTERLNTIEDKIDRLANRESAVAVPVSPQGQVQAPSQPTSSKKKDACEAKRRRLQFRAQVAALDNVPPGNMADGEAYDLAEEARLLDCD